MHSSYAEFLVKIVNMYPHLKIAVTLQDWETDFLRFYNSQVNYNISKDNLRVGVQVYKGKRSTSFLLENPTNKDILQGIEEASIVIDKLPEDPHFVDLEDNLDVAESKEKENNIKKVPLEKKIGILKQIAEAVAPYGYNIYGTFICNYQTVCFINSNGINKKMISSPIMLELKAVAEENEVTVIESYGGESLETFDIDRFVSDLVAKIKVASNEIIDVEPDSYEVILAPRAIAQYVSYLTFAGMSAGSYDRKRSYFEDKIDQKVFPDNITITDDPDFQGLINIAYNSEGHIYQKTPLIEKGVFKNFLIGNYYSHKTGLKKNGGEGSCLVMDTGDKKLEEMLKGVKKGLYISNLHYMNFINAKETSITGLTRDGTFLIENGEMKNVVNNLRFTVKIVDVLKNITEIEDTHHIIPSSNNYGSFSINSSAMPHVRVSAFKITSSTKTI